MPTTLTTPTNIIYSGVAGTGKTYQLLQLAKRYTDVLPTASDEMLLMQLLTDVSWRDTICLIFLDLQFQHQELARVPEIMAHEFFIAKASQNQRDKNLSNTAWSVLQMHSPVSSQTVTYKNRAIQAYFDKDESGAWYLLPNNQPLLQLLIDRLEEFYQARRDALATDNKAQTYERYSLVSFHQAYGYEEFVEGIRPVMGQGQGAQGSSGQMSYAVQDGAFLALCQRAASDPHRRYAMLVDEINRANVARVFGELLSLIEPDKRAGMPSAMSVRLAYSGRAFSVPANVDIYATMNTQDHSLAPLDMALRRRFRFIDCAPQPDLLPIICLSNDDSDGAETIDLAKILAGLNARISQVLGSSAQLGQAFLWTVSTIADLQLALTQQIIPQLAQAAGGQVAVLQYIFVDDNQALSRQFIQDAQALLAQQHSSTHSSEQPSVFNAAGFADYQGFHSQSFNNQSFNMQGLGATDYQINPDLINGVGEFANSAIYQRLYVGAP